MKRALAISFCLATGLIAQDAYTPGPDTLARASGVAAGTVTQHKWTSKIFPGTVRDYWVYVPAKSNGGKPYPVMIIQDGGGFVSETGAWRAPIVFDNLIHRGEIPPMVGIFINPGVLPARSDNEQARYNRSFEYDAVSDRYARFLVDEILPEVNKMVPLSSDPSDRGIAGSSSGGIAAFAAAWFRPDQFRRVMTYIGSYVNLRGAHDLIGQVRKFENKPMRVYLQDGSNDNNLYGGSWWIANQDLNASLEFKGYDVTFVTGTEGHNSKHGSAVFPDAMRWLWRGYPAKIEAAPPRSNGRFLLTDANSKWELISEGHGFTEGPAISPSGELFFSDVRGNKIWRVPKDGKPVVFKEVSGPNGLMFSKDGTLYACIMTGRKLVKYAPDGTETVLVDGVAPNDLFVTAKGDIYFTEPAAKKLWLLRANGERKVVHEGFDFPNGVLLSPDQSLLMLNDSRSKWVWSFQVQPDGTLAHGQPFYRLETSDESSASSADGMTIDSEGFLYVATRIGLQMCDAPGRVNAILDKPQNGPLSNAVLHGNTMYVTARDKVYKRTVNRTGVLPWEIVKPPVPRL